MHAANTCHMVFSCGMSPLLLLVFLNFSKCVGVGREILYCYVTEYDTLETFDTDSPPSPTDCRRYMEDKMKSQKITLPWYYWDNNLRCYTIGVRAKFWQQNDTEDVDIRRCAFKDHCDDFLDDIRLEMMMSSAVGIIKCSECNGNLCNSRITHDNLIKVKNKTNPYRRNLYIGAGGCSVVGIIGAFARCLFCRKSKNTVPVNV